MRSKYTLCLIRVIQHLCHCAASTHNTKTTTLETAKTSFSTKHSSFISICNLTCQDMFLKVPMNSNKSLFLQPVQKIQGQGQTHPQLQISEKIIHIKKSNLQAKYRLIPVLVHLFCHFMVRCDVLFFCHTLSFTVMWRTSRDLVSFSSKISLRYYIYVPKEVYPLVMPMPGLPRNTQMAPLVFTL